MYFIKPKIEKEKYNPREYVARDPVSRKVYSWSDRIWIRRYFLNLLWISFISDIIRQYFAFEPQFIFIFFKELGY